LSVGENFIGSLIYLVAVTTIASGATYMISWGRNIEPIEKDLS